MAKKPEPTAPIIWDIYRAAAKARPLGTVEAVDADEGDREGRQGAQGHRQQADRGAAAMAKTR